MERPARFSYAAAYHQDALTKLSVETQSKKKKNIYRVKSEYKKK